MTVIKKWIQNKLCLSYVKMIHLGMKSVSGIYRIFISRRDIRLIFYLLYFQLLSD